jgi:hypothetical protein
MRGDRVPRHLQLLLVALLLWSISCSFGEPNPAPVTKCLHLTRPAAVQGVAAEIDPPYLNVNNLNTTRIFTTGRNCALNVTAPAARPRARDPPCRVRCPSRATLTQPYRWVRSACASRDMIEFQLGVITCDTPSDGDEVPGLQWFASAGRCHPGDSFGVVDFTFTPPPNAYLHIPPTNQITFCFSLRVSSQPSGTCPALCPSSLTHALPTPVPLSTTCAHVIVSRCRCVFVTIFRRIAITERV